MAGSLSLEAIADLVGGRLVGDGAVTVAGIAPVDEAGPGPLELGHHVERIDAGLAPHQAGDEPDLAIEHLRRLDPAFGPPLAELGEGDAVERAGDDVVAESERAEAVPQLSRGLPGEGEGEHPARVGLVDRDPIGDATGEHSGLAGAGTREHDERPALGGDGAALGFVQAGEQALGIHGDQPSDEG